MCPDAGTSVLTRGTKIGCCRQASNAQIDASLHRPVHEVATPDTTGSRGGRQIVLLQFAG